MALTWTKPTSMQCNVSKYFLHRYACIENKNIQIICPKVLMHVKLIHQALHYVIQVSTTLRMGYMGIQSWLHEIKKPWCL